VLFTQNNMRANVTMLSYDGHDSAVKLLHSLDCTVWDRKVEAILESGSSETLMVDELFLKYKSAEVDRGVTAWIESPTDLLSLTLAGGSGVRCNANSSCRMYSPSSLMSSPDEEFDVLGEDELALLTKRFERMHELEPGEHKEELMDMLLMRQARTLHHRLSRGDGG
jgi:hypothetical protein